MLLGEAGVLEREVQALILVTVSVPWILWTHRYSMNVLKRNQPWMPGGAQRVSPHGDFHILLSHVRSGFDYNWCL